MGQPAACQWCRCHRGGAVVPPIPSAIGWHSRRGHLASARHAHRKGDPRRRAYPAWCPRSAINTGLSMAGVFALARLAGLAGALAAPVQRATTLAGFVLLNLIRHRDWRPGFEPRGARIALSLIGPAFRSFGSLAFLVHRRMMYLFHGESGLVSRPTGLFVKGRPCPTAGRASGEAAHFRG